MESKKIILIVEDDATISASLKEFLEDNDFEVLTAHHGSEALKVLRSCPKPSLILLDLMMPIMDGFEFRQHQLAEPAWKDIPVIVMSADGHIEEKRVRSGAQDYLKKPLDIFNLLDAIQKLTT